MTTPSTSVGNLGGDMTKHPINERTQDLRGNEVNGELWLYVWENFQASATAFRSAGNDRAAEIAERLVASTDDVPAELIQEQQDFWNRAADQEDDGAAWEQLEDVDDQMMEELARGEYTPDNATVFVMEFIRRVSGIRMS
jgi:hypothetical protein